MTQASMSTELQKRAEGYLDAALLLEIRLTEDESAYDLPYIRGKLTKITSAAETLSDYAIQLTKIHLEVVRQAAEARSLARVKEQTLREGESYRKLSREEKTPWLMKEMAVYRDNAEEWGSTLLFVQEIRDAVSERVQMVRRLDSALRLHEKILDATKKGVGVFGSPPSRGGMPVGELRADPSDGEIHLT